ncbi:hypothetical protein I4F81_011179 [Pyropia yezoensis]|uniref:Uncharacterized protein n=1 Tax=Pyropia yezoensis TaxID=2788 RepID=A0ACC3CEK8_PYRYE|nr:hypothetical protein I4F81_011179 [Neopyropia yezoensis]
MASPYDGYGPAEGEDATTASLAAALGLTEQAPLGSGVPDGAGGRGGADASILSAKGLLHNSGGSRGAAGAAASDGVVAGRRQPPPSGLLADDAAADVYRYRLDAASLPSRDGDGGGRPLSASAASAVAALGGEAGDWSAAATATGGGAATAGVDMGGRSSALSAASAGLAPVGADVAALSSSLGAQLAAAAVAASRRVPQAGAGVGDCLGGQVHGQDGGGGHLGGSGTPMNPLTGGRPHHGDSEVDHDGEEADVDVEDDADEEKSGVCVGGNNAGEESTSSRTPLSAAADMSMDTGAGEASVSTAATAAAGGGALAGAPKKKQVRARVGDLSPDMIHRCPFDGCSKKFAKKYNLKIHVRRHTGELPFACGLVTCGKRFMWHSSFLRHQRSHEKRSKGRVKEQSLPGGEAERGDGGEDNAHLLTSALSQLPVREGLAGASLAGLDAGRPSGSSPSPMALPAYSSSGYGGRELLPSASEAAGGNNLFTGLHSLNVLNCLSSSGGGGGGGGRLSGSGGGVRLGSGGAMPAELAGLGGTGGFSSLTSLLDGGAGAGMGPSALPAPPLPTGVAGTLGMPVTLCMSPRQAASSAMVGTGVPNYFDPAIPAGGGNDGGGAQAADDGGAAARARGGGGSMHFLASPGLSQLRFRDLHTSSHLPPAVADHGLPPSGRPGKPPMGPTMVSLLTDEPVTGFGVRYGPNSPSRGSGAPAPSVAAAVTVTAAAAAASRALAGAAASAMGHTGLDDACFSPVSGTTGLGGLQATASVLLDEDSGCGAAGSGVGGSVGGKEDGRQGPAGDGSSVGGGGGGGSGGGGSGDGGGDRGGCPDVSSPESAADGRLADPVPDGREACVLSPPAAAKRNPWTSDDLCHNDSFHGDFDAAFDFFTH